MGFKFEEADRSCRKWFYEDFDDEANGMAMAWRGVDVF